MSGRGFIIVLGLLVAAPALALPSMIRHGYQSCATCHVDPSGSGQLTAYGRAQADTLLRWKPSQPPKGQEQEVSRTANFLWFLELPQWLNLSGNLRAGALFPIGSPVRPVFMSNEVSATVKFGQFVAHGQTGIGIRNAGPAAILPACTQAPCGVQWVAREFWAGATFNDDAVVLRGGRLNLPFGLRNNEHTSWVRASTRTDTNVGQQYGASVSYTSETVRAELMGIAGNFQLSPDDYRERGYSGLAEYALTSELYIGLSSLITYARADLANQQPLTRHAHGLMVRWSPHSLVALLAEFDFLAWQQPNQIDRLGFTGWLQADFEPWQGVHFMATAETLHEGAQAGPSLGGWASAAWYVLPHVELRFDGIVRRFAPTASSAAATSVTFLAQVHFFL